MGTVMGTVMGDGAVLDVGRLAGGGAAEERRRHREPHGEHHAVGHRSHGRTTSRPAPGDGRPIPGCRSHRAVGRVRPWPQLPRSPTATSSCGRTRSRTSRASSSSARTRSASSGRRCRFPTRSRTPAGSSPRSCRADGPTAPRPASPSRSTAGSPAPSSSATRGRVAGRSPSAPIPGSAAPARWSARSGCSSTGASPTAEPGCRLAREPRQLGVAQAGLAARLPPRGDDQGGPPPAWRAARRLGRHPPGRRRPDAAGPLARRTGARRGGAPAAAMA